jgi:hypothetical protein
VVYFGQVGDSATGTSNLWCLDETQDRDVNTMELAGALDNLCDLLPPGSVDIESRQGSEQAPVRSAEHQGDVLT